MKQIGLLEVEIIW